MAAAAFIILLFAGAVACGGDNSNNGGKLKVVTSLPLFADMVRQVGGDRVDVSALLPAGADPHTYEPSPGDVKSVAEARLAVINGLDLEPAAEKIIRANTSGDVVVLAEEARLAGVQVLDDNPHLWLDAGAGQDYARVIHDALAKADNGGAATYDANLERYSGEIEQTDSYTRQKIAAIPAANRKLVTTHDGFPYLAAHLGLAIVAFAAESPGQDPTPQDIADLTKALEEQHVPAVFTEPQIESANKTLEQAASAAGVKVCTLYSDSLDDKVNSYVAVLRFDADELARCLGGASGG